MRKEIMKQLSFEDDFTVLQRESQDQSPDQSVTVPEGPPARSMSSTSLRDAVKKELRRWEQARKVYIHKKLARKDDPLDMSLTIDEMLSVLRSILNGNQDRDRKLEEIRQWVKQWVKRKK